MPRVNKSQYALLGFLSKRDLSGYDLLRIFERIGPFFWTESNAQVYPMLKKLEQQGMVQSVLDDRSGARQRRIYSITAEGKAHLIDWLNEPLSEPRYREELCLRMAFGQFQSRAQLLQKLDEFSIQLQRQLQQVTKAREHFDVEHAGRADQMFLQMNMDYTETVLKAKQQWCQQAREKCDKKQ
jgi:PadR family transcriptional regulator, regulatory protein AphA